MSKAEDYIREHSHIIENPTSVWISSYNARKAVEIAREEELEYVKYQLELKLPETLDYNGIKVNRKDFINDLTKAIEDE